MVDEPGSDLFPSAGISRSEGIRRQLIKDTFSIQEACTDIHLKNLLELMPDLADERVMADAWR